jgi:hypothetical protein
VANEVEPLDKTFEDELQKILLESGLSIKLGAKRTWVDFCLTAGNGQRSFSVPSECIAMWYFAGELEKRYKEIAEMLAKK